jgi:hypothetical protein
MYSVHILLWLLVAPLAQAGECTPLSQPGERCRVLMSHLRPTQGAIGLVDVQVKRLDLQEAGSTLLKEERAPLVVGPNGNFYLIDKHHLTYAAYQEGWRHTYGEVVANLSDLSESEFWKEMQRRNWTRLKGPKGEVLSPDELPKHIRGLKDDPYRSLAWLVRKSDAFQKKDIPFAEFEWADFFRSRIRIADGRDGWERAVDRALALALTEEVEHLPGSKPVAPSRRNMRHRECWQIFQALSGWK